LQNRNIRQSGQNKFASFWCYFLAIRGKALFYKIDKINKD